MTLEDLRTRKWLASLLLVLGLGGMAACEGNVEGDAEIQENGGGEGEGEEGEGGGVDAEVDVNEEEDE